MLFAALATLGAFPPVAVLTLLTWEAPPADPQDLDGLTGHPLWLLLALAFWVAWRRYKRSIEPSTWIRFLGASARHTALRTIAPLVVSVIYLYTKGMEPDFAVEDRPFAMAITWWGTGALLEWFFGGLRRRATYRAVRGRELHHFETLRDRLHEQNRLADPEHPDTINWGGLPFQASLLAPHFVVTGVTDSGKSLTLEMLMADVFRVRRPKSKGAPRVRALVYDAKRDALPTLMKPGVGREHITLTNPFDERCARWDLAADITDEASATELAWILVEQETRDSNPFFINATRNIVRQLLVNLHASYPGSWRLNDLVLATLDDDALTSLLERSPAGRAISKRYLGPGSKRTKADILSTLENAMRPYATVAELWERTNREFSLRTWLEGRSVLVLGCDEARERSLGPINRALFKRASELLLSRGDTEAPDSWLFLDEVRAAGKLDGLLELLIKGRSKGVRVAIGFQDIQGLRAVYGRDEADELVAQCGNLAILRLNSPETLEWASRLFGHYEYIQVSETTAGVGGADSTTRSLSSRAALLPSQVKNLPPTTRTNGLTGFFGTPVIGSWGVCLSADFIDWRTSGMAGGGEPEPGYIPWKNLSGGGGAAKTGGSLNPRKTPEPANLSLFGWKLKTPAENRS